jgi:hypothetical protein
MALRTSMVSHRIRKSAGSKARMEKEYGGSSSRS